jgi:bacteriocin-like protein
VGRRRRTLRSRTARRTESRQAVNKPIEVPSAGEPEWQGEITEDKLAQVIGGLLIPNQAFSKAMARKLREYMRKEQQ